MELGSHVLSAAISPTSSTVSGVQPSLRTLGHRGGRTEGSEDKIKYLQHMGTWNLLTGSWGAESGLQRSFAAPAGLLKTF